MSLSKAVSPSLASLQSDPNNSTCFECNKSYAPFVCFPVAIFLCDACTPRYIDLKSSNAYVKRVSDDFLPHELKWLSSGGNLPLRCFLGDDNLTKEGKDTKLRKYITGMTGNTTDELECLCCKTLKLGAARISERLRKKISKATAGSFCVLAGLLMVGGEKGFETAEWGALKFIRLLEWGAEASAQLVNKWTDFQKGREDEALDVVVLEIDEEDSFELI